MGVLQRQLKSSFLESRVFINYCKITTNFLKLQQHNSFTFKLARAFYSASHSLRQHSTKEVKSNKIQVHS
jgi:hypothetical protein